MFSCRYQKEGNIFHSTSRIIFLWREKSSWTIRLPVRNSVRLLLTKTPSSWGPLWRRGIPLPYPFWALALLSGARCAMTSTIRFGYLPGHTQATGSPHHASATAGSDYPTVPHSLGHHIAGGDRHPLEGWSIFAALPLGNTTHSPAHMRGFAQPVMHWLCSTPPT